MLRAILFIEPIFNSTVSAETFHQTFIYKTFSAHVACNFAFSGYYDPFGLMLPFTVPSTVMVEVPLISPSIVTSELMRESVIRNPFRSYSSISASRSFVLCNAFMMLPTDKLRKSLIAVAWNPNCFKHCQHQSSTFRPKIVIKTTRLDLRLSDRGCQNSASFPC